MHRIRVLVITDGVDLRQLAQATFTRPPPVLLLTDRGSSSNPLRYKLSFLLGGGPPAFKIPCAVSCDSAVPLYASSMQDLAQQAPSITSEGIGGVIAAPSGLTPPSTIFPLLSLSFERRANG